MKKKFMGELNKVHRKYECKVFISSSSSSIVVAVAVVVLVVAVVAVGFWKRDGGFPTTILSSVEQPPIQHRHRLRTTVALRSFC
ncbi:hypothetical protein Avbf_08744 [Armadillidium vulgare]|nr:hypothetical protein Avbf_08744 [Armadillidium vulgare]